MSFPIGMGPPGGFGGPNQAQGVGLRFMDMKPAHRAWLQAAVAKEAPAEQAPEPVDREQLAEPE